MDAKGEETGPLKPEHIREAFKQMQADGRALSSSSQYFSTASVGRAMRR
jgi:hypothetical protein